MTHDTQELVAEAITEWFGPRCEARDTDELPELRGKSEGRCPACLAWEQYDALTAQAEEIRALRSAEDGFGDTLGSAAVGHLRLMYPAAFETLGPSGRRSLRNFINARAALAGKGKP